MLGEVSSHSSEFGRRVRPGAVPMASCQGLRFVRQYLPGGGDPDGAIVGGLNHEWGNRLVLSHAAERSASLELLLVSTRPSRVVHSNHLSGIPRSRSTFRKKNHWHCHINVAYPKCYPKESFWEISPVNHFSLM